MTDRTILGYIKYISKRNLVFPVIVLVLMVVLLLVLPFKQVLTPPTVSSFSEITEYSDEGTTYLHVTLDDLTYTGYDLHKDGNSGYAGYYYYMNKTEEDDPSVICYFFLIGLSGSTDIEKNVYIDSNVKILRNDKYFDIFISDYSSEIGWSTQGLKYASKGILLSEVDYDPKPMITLLILICLVILLCIAYIILNLITLISPTHHEACRRLKKYGLDSDDFKDIDRELARERIVSAGNLIVTDHYFIAFTSSNIYVVPLFNIVWAYKYSRWHRLNRRSRLTYSLIIVTSPKTKVTVPGNRKRDADAVLRFFRRDISHITVGYTEEIRKQIEESI